MVRRGCVVLVAIVATGATGCVQILGLDHGSPEDADGGDGVNDAPDATPAMDSSRGEAAAGDVANDDRGVDAPHATDATGATDAQATPDTARGPDAACAYTVCPDGCWDTANDPMHCGSCTRECAPAANSHTTCSAGVCGYVCDQGYVDCAGQVCSCGGGKVCLSNNTCGACRPALQPCQVGSDCCSGSCGASLTCL